MTRLTEERLSDALKTVVPAAPPGPDRAARARARATVLRRRRFVAVGTALVAAVTVASATIALRADDDGTAHVVGKPSPAATGRHCATAGCLPAKIVAAVQRPLHLPSMPDDGRCPVSRAHDLPDGAEGFTGRVRATGDGPLSIAGFVGPSPTTMAVRRSGHGWLEQKVVWAFAEDYAGPLLLRGGRIDAPGRLGFHRYIGAYGYRSGAGDGPHDRLLYLRGGLGATPTRGGEAGTEPSGIYVRSPGCYAIQADGEGVTGTLVFRVVRQ